MAEKTCRHCKERLKTGATKCGSCQSYQTEKLHFWYNTSLISLVAAVVSVLGAGWSTIVGRGPQPPNLHVSYVGITPDKVKVAITNNGTTVKLERISLDVRGLNKGQKLVHLATAWPIDKKLKRDEDREFSFSPEDASEAAANQWIVFAPENWSEEWIDKLKPKMVPIPDEDIETVAECKISIEVWGGSRKLVRELNNEECSQLDHFIIKQRETTFSYFQTMRGLFGQKSDQR